MLRLYNTLYSFFQIQGSSAKPPRRGMHRPLAPFGQATHYVLRTAGFACGVSTACPAWPRPEASAFLRTLRPQSGAGAALGGRIAEDSALLRTFRAQSLARPLASWLCRNCSLRFLRVWRILPCRNLQPPKAGEISTGLVPIESSGFCGRRRQNAPNTLRLLPRKNHKTCPLLCEGSFLYCRRRKIYKMEILNVDNYEIE